jgi:hypothetical protein
MLMMRGGVCVAFIVLGTHSTPPRSHHTTSSAASSAADDWSAAASAGALPWARQARGVDMHVPRWGPPQQHRTGTNVHTSSSGPSGPSARSAQTIELRRLVYSDRLTRISAPLGRHKPRDTSAAAMSDARGGLERLRPWLRRELFVLAGASPPHRDFLFTLITTLVQVICTATLPKTTCTVAHRSPVDIRVVLHREMCHNVTNFPANQPTHSHTHPLARSLACPAAAVRAATWAC